MFCFCSFKNTFQRIEVLSKKRNLLSKSGFSGWTVAFQNCEQGRNAEKSLSIFADFFFTVINQMCFTLLTKKIIFRLLAFLLNLLPIVCLKASLPTYVVCVVGRKYTYFHPKRGWLLVGMFYNTTYTDKNYWKVFGFLHE